MFLYRGIVTSKLPLQGYGRKITKNVVISGLHFNFQVQRLVS